MSIRISMGGGHHIIRQWGLVRGWLKIERVGLWKDGWCLTMLGRILYVRSSRLALDDAGQWIGHLKYTSISMSPCINAMPASLMISYVSQIRVVWRSSDTTIHNMPRNRGQFDRKNYGTCLALLLFVHASRSATEKTKPQNQFQRQIRLAINLSRLYQETTRCAKVKPPCQTDLDFVRYNNIVVVSWKLLSKWVTWCAYCS